MSKPVSALGGVKSAGYVNVQECAPFGMVTLRAKLSDKTIAANLKDVLGCPLPNVRKMSSGTYGRVAWMSPDELLCLSEYSKAYQLREQIKKGFQEHHVVAEVVSDARTIFRIEGARAGEVLTKLAPVDVERLAADEMRRTRLAQVPAAFWRIEDGFELMCFRSVSGYVFDLLKTAASPCGQVF